MKNMNLANARIAIRIFLLGGMVGVMNPAWGAIISATSCSSSAVQTALNSATTGDTVIVPGGTCIWTTQVSWTAPADVILQGAGNASVGGGDQTVITDNYSNGNASLLVITTNASGTFRLTGITFQGALGAATKYGTLSINGQSKRLRIDHIHINVVPYGSGWNGHMIDFSGWINGVIDHSLFDLNDVTNGLSVWYDGYTGGGSEGDGAFADVSGLGGTNFIFVEDNIFNSPTAFGTSNDCSHGGKYVWRYNTMHTSSVQTHPTGGSGRGRGCRAWEIYNNSFDGAGSANPNYNAAFLSSGTGVIWGNTAPNGFQNFVTLHSMRKDNTTYIESATPTGWGYCGTSFNGTGSNWDQNTDAVTGYACLDQPGRGVGDLLTGSFPNVVNTATGCTSSSVCAWPRQALEPVYEWLNTWTTEGGGSFWSVHEPTVLVQNRDYYLHASPFTGAAGTGTGLLSARPATCTPAAAYWATDTNTLYQCLSANSWTAYYTPYTYPHPLVGSPMSAPVDLRVL
jgi:hypothetical protein